MKIYLISRFSWNGLPSYRLPILGLSLEERIRKHYPQAELSFDAPAGKNGEELLGLSLRTLADYPALCERIQREILLFHLRNGVLIPDMGGTYVEEEVVIGKGTYLGHGCHVERGTVIGENCRIGPFAYLRTGAKVGHGCRVGDFTEIKNASLGDGSKMSHLAYLGDADVGKNCNIGCGAVFVNYDGRKKCRTIVEDNVFIGSNCNLVAPVHVGAGAYIACGSTLTCDLAANDFCIARSRETIKPQGGSGRFSPS